MAPLEAHWTWPANFSSSPGTATLHKNFDKRSTEARFEIEVACEGCYVLPVEVDGPPRLPCELVVLHAVAWCSKMCAATLQGLQGCAWSIITLKA